MTGRSLAIGFAMLLLGFLLGVTWNRSPGPAHAPRSPTPAPAANERPAARDSSFVKLSSGAPTKTTRKSSVTMSVPEPLGPDSGGDQAAIEFDFRGIPEKAWIRCLAVVEGPGLDGIRTRRAEKPYRGGRVSFTVPAGRWRVVWRTSFQLRDEHGKILRLKANDHVVIDAVANTGDPPEKWIWPGLGMIEIDVLAPTGKPLRGAHVVLSTPGLTADASSLRTGTDHLGRCRLELIPGRHELLVGWKRVKATAEAGKVTRLHVDGRTAGSLVVRSAKSEFIRIRRRGTLKWCGPDLTGKIEWSSDEMRFDLLPPGDYEVAIQGGAEIVGTVTLHAGVEAELDLRE